MARYVINGGSVTGFISAESVSLTGLNMYPGKGGNIYIRHFLGAYTI